MFILIYRPHNALHIDTMHIGPFASFDEAYECLSAFPALGHPNPSAVCANDELESRGIGPDEYVNHIHAPQG